jgi:hypothetical protein
MRNMPGRQRLGSNPRIKFAAAPGDDSMVLKSQLQTAKCDFKTSRAFIVSNQQIRDTQRERIQSTAGGNSKLPKAGAAQILHAREKSCALCNRVHSSVILNEVKDLP